MYSTILSVTVLCGMQSLTNYCRCLLHDRAKDVMAALTHMLSIVLKLQVQVATCNGTLAQDVFERILKTRTLFDGYVLSL